MGNAISLDRLNTGNILANFWRWLKVVSWMNRQQVERPTIICLCGSTRFAATFHEANLRETLAGKIVLTIGCDMRSDADLLLAGELTAEDKARLDELHLRKIDLCDEILVLNVGGYIGQSTRREIAYARGLGKRVRWWESSALGDEDSGVEVPAW